MFKTGKLVGFAVVAVLALSGCASAGSSEDVAKSGAGEATSAPALTAEPVEATAAETEYDTAIRRIPGLEDIDQADALVVGENVCTQLDAGTDPLTITAVEDTERVNNWDAISVATLTLCPSQTAAVGSVRRSCDRRSRGLSGNLLA